MPSLPPLAELAPGLSAAGALGPADIEALAASGVRTIVNNRPDNEDPGQLPAPEAAASRRRTASPTTTSGHRPDLVARRCRSFCRGVALGGAADGGALPQRHPFDIALGFDAPRRRR